MKMQECIEILERNTPEDYRHDMWMANMCQMTILTLHLDGLSIPIDKMEIEGKTDDEVKTLIIDRILTTFKEAITRIEPGHPKKEYNMIEALQDNVIIELTKNPTVATKIILPDRVASCPKFGTVRFIGPEVDRLTEGDVVVLPTWNDDELEVDGKKYIVLAEKNISVRVS